jgi:hypothetical protein
MYNVEKRGGKKEEFVEKERTENPKRKTKKEQKKQPSKKSTQINSVLLF